jgi:hypothetical protein
VKSPEYRVMGSFRDCNFYSVKVNLIHTCWLFVLFPPAVYYHERPRQCNLSTTDSNTKDLVVKRCLLSVRPSCSSGGHILLASIRRSSSHLDSRICSLAAGSIWVSERTAAAEFLSSDIVLGSRLAITAFLRTERFERILQLGWF